MRWPLLVLGLVLAQAPPAGIPPAMVVRVEMTEFAFRPAIIRLPAGTLLTLRFVNRGRIAHQFETGYLRATPVVVIDATLHVEAPGLDFVRLEPGASGSLTFFARRAGRFPFACTIEGHREAGMVGILEVRY